MAIFAAYSSGDYATAVTDYQKAAGELTGAELERKAYYKLGLAYDKLGGHTPDALSAYQQAKTIDPSESFATNPASFERKLARDSGGGNAAPAEAGGPAGTSPRPRAVQKRKYSCVGRSGDVGAEDIRRLRGSIPHIPGGCRHACTGLSAKSDSHTTVKIGMMPHCPADVVARAGA